MQGYCGFLRVKIKLILSKKDIILAGLSVKVKFQRVDLKFHDPIQCIS